MRKEVGMLFFWNIAGPASGYGRNFDVSGSNIGLNANVLKLYNNIWT